MESGNDFLKDQVSNVAAQHEAFVQSLEDHARQATDPRFRELCSKYVPRMRQHQSLLEQYRRTLGAEPGTVRKALAMVVNMGKDLVDAARGDDFLRLIGDIVMARQAEDSFKTFREAGRTLGLTDLHRLGEAGESEHDEFVQEANRLVQQLFVERARTAVPTTV